MIDVKDLMVGNWVKVFDPEYKDDTLDYWDIYEIREDGVRLGLFSDIFECEWLEGIEVTEEVLEKVGFEKHKNFPLAGDFYRYWHKDYRYKLDVDKGYCNSNRRWSLHVDNGDCCTIGRGEFTYLHELMNLTRVITGYELKIDKEVFYGLDD